MQLLAAHEGGRRRFRSGAADPGRQDPRRPGRGSETAPKELYTRRQVTYPTGPGATRVDAPDHSSGLSTTRARRPGSSSETRSRTSLHVGIASLLPAGGLSGPVPLERSFL